VIGTFDFADLHFTVWQGNGGHVPGETVLTDEAHRIAITGDDYINARDCTAPQKEFNQLAPYLARSVNQDSAKYRLILRALKDMMDGEGWLILPGHGAILQRDQRM
ncbi:MAG: MBL fold metallo-hydrolase, partial [Clostridia bacterium]|nr:MBL fold metallo-hydrolase [Clostridia bacterium]